MLYTRKKIILAIIDIFGGAITAKQLQKYLFLFTRKQEVMSYKFVPYHYGCYSFLANVDVVSLGKEGYINIAETDKGRFLTVDKQNHYINELDIFDQQSIRDLKNEFGKYTQEELIRYTYIHFPFYAINSHIASKILSNDELLKVDKQRNKDNAPMLFTIGYEGLSIEEYLVKLLINNVRILCNVRKNAYSQKYGFSKAVLSKACDGIGVRYIHIPELGIESNKRQTLNSQKDYDILFNNYENSTLKDNWTYLLGIKKLIQSDKRVALTCFEKNPKQCHRSRVAKYLMTLPNTDYKLKEL